MTDSTIRTAVAILAETPRRRWPHFCVGNSGGVTDMSYLFCGYSGFSSYGCNTWRPLTRSISFERAPLSCIAGCLATPPPLTSHRPGTLPALRRLYWMFTYAPSFNQDLSGWAVDSVAALSQYVQGGRPSTRTSAGAWTALSRSARSTTPRARRGRRARAGGLVRSALGKNNGRRGVALGQRRRGRTQATSRRGRPAA